jgi:hypothetical protein
MTTFNLTCDAIEATLPDYLDNTLEEWLREPIEEHLRECAQCAARARDLLNIEREAAALPALLPDHELWSEIAHRIGAPVGALEPVSETAPLILTPEPVVSATDAAPTTTEPLLESEPPAVNTEPPPASVLSIEPSSPPTDAPAPSSEPRMSSSTALVPTTALKHASHVRRKTRWRPAKIRWGPAAMGLAAAALVVVTAGITFLATARWLGPAQNWSFVFTRSAAQRVAARAAPQRASSRAMPPVVPRVQAQPIDTQHVASDSSGSMLAAGAAPSALAVAATPASQVTLSPDQVVYDKEIRMLRGVVRERKSELDTSTAGVIDKNLGIVNSAIAQCRAALQKDPGNSLIDSQMSWALEMKIELLRRAAMLQSSG